jgi:hypothetical protein
MVKGLSFFSPCVLRQPIVGQSLHIVEAVRSDSPATSHSVGLPWTSDQPLAETSTHKRQTYMLPAGFETVILTSERPETHVLGGVATGIG